MNKPKKNRTEELKFFTKILTPSNPKDAFYVNVEQRVQTYLLVISFGMMMIAFMVITLWM